VAEAHPDTQRRSPCRAAQRSKEIRDPKWESIHDIERHLLVGGTAQRDAEDLRPGRGVAATVDRAGEAVG
jgi:hypothetical protein